MFWVPSASKRSRVGAAVVASAVAALMLAPSPAGAAAPTFTASFAPPASSNAGALTPYELQVSSNQGTIAKVIVTAPDGFAIAGGASASQISFNGLRISGSTVATLSFSAYAACTPNPYAWRVDAVQKDGTPYAPNTAVSTVNSITTETPTACRVRFSGQPASAVVTHVHTTVPYSEDRSDPVDPHPVAVEVFRADGKTDPSYSGSVELTLPASPGALSGGSAIAVHGTAEFAPTINEVRFGWILEASAANVTARARSTSFQTTETFENCRGGTCSETAYGTEILSATVSAPGAVKNDIVTVGVDGMPLFDCFGYSEVVTTEATGFDYTGDGPKIVTDLISKEVMNTLPQNGASLIETCLASTVKFLQKDGTFAPFDADLGMYVGVIPDCKTKSQVYCNVSKTKTVAGVGEIVYRVGEGDPAGRH